MTGSTSKLEENRIWPWRGNGWEIWARNLGNLFAGHWVQNWARISVVGEMDRERKMQCWERRGGRIHN